MTARDAIAAALANFQRIPGIVERARTAPCTCGRLAYPHRLAAECHVWAAEQDEARDAQRAIDDADRRNLEGMGR